MGRTRTRARGVSSEHRWRPRFPCPRRRPRHHAGIHAGTCRRSERARPRSTDRRIGRSPLMAHRVAPRAEADLDDIWLYVSKDSGSMDVATRLIDSITDRFLFLASRSE